MKAKFNILTSTCVPLPLENVEKTYFGTGVMINRGIKLTRSY